MKKLLLCLLASLLSVGAAFAQRGLNSNAIFRGQVIPSTHMVKTEVRGSSMTTYKLDFYRSVRFRIDEKTALEVAALVKADADAAVSAETEMTGDLLTYALVQPAQRGKVHRYLCYQARPEGPAWVITILYLEGSATLEDLRSMFDKQ
ncbi:MAG: DUF6108 family protein [Bacteroidales bacterium]|nr:DUF6108 family protein [Bacteroidales bacterium]